MPERTEEEKIHILHLYWTGAKTEEDKELLSSIKDDEKSSFITTLNEIILGEPDVKLMHSGDNLESIYMTYEVNLR